MKIAVTGGSGGIGRAVTSLALAHGHSVVSIERRFGTTVLCAKLARTATSPQSILTITGVTTPTCRCGYATRETKLG